MQGEQTVLRIFRVLILNEHSAKGGTFSSLAVRAGTGVPIRIGLCLVVLLQNCLVVRQTKCGSVLSCHGRYYCLSPTLLPTRRELKLNCSRSRPLYEIALGRPNSDTPPLEQPLVAAQVCHVCCVDRAAATDQLCLCVSCATPARAVTGVPMLQE